MWQRTGGRHYPYHLRAESSGQKRQVPRISEEALTGFNAAFVPGKYLVEMFPSMRYLPSWLPWAKFKREANGCRLAALKIRNVTWEDAIKAIVSSLMRAICLASYGR